MKKAILLAAAAGLMILSSCGKSDSSSDGRKDSVTLPEGIETKAPGSREIDTDELRDKFPEYFMLSTQKGIGVYVWKMSENSFSCALAEDGDGKLNDEKIQKLSEKPLSAEQAKAIINELGIKPEDVTVYPTQMKFSSYYYEVNEEYRSRVKALFDQYPLFSDSKEQNNKGAEE